MGHTRSVETAGSCDDRFFHALFIGIPTFLARAFMYLICCRCFCRTAEKEADGPGGDSSVAKAQYRLGPDGGTAADSVHLASTKKSDLVGSQFAQLNTLIIREMNEHVQRVHGVDEDDAREMLARVGLVEGKYDLDKATQAMNDATVEGVYGLTKTQRALLTNDFTKLNELTKAGEKPEWLKFLEELTGFFALLLWFGAVLCIIGYFLRYEADNLALGIVLATVVLVTGIFSYSQNSQAASLMSSFEKLLREEILVLTDQRPTLAGKDKEVDSWVKYNCHNSSLHFDAKYLVPGDVVYLNQGKKIPADIRLLSGDGFGVDNSPLTGEPDVLERSRLNTETDPKEATNMVFFGTDAKNKSAVGVVVRTGDETFIGKIAQLTEGTANEDTPINKEIHHFISIVSAVAIFLGITFFIIGFALGTDPITNLVFMIGIIVANVPEGLLATVTVSLSLTASAMFNKNVLVKNMESVETLGSTTCICSDKTGTLTQNRMTCAEVVFDKTIYRTDFVDPGADRFEDLSAVCEKSASWMEFYDALCLNTTATFTGEGQYTGDRVTPFFTKRSPTALPVVAWNGIDGDASEAAMIKLAQYMSPDAYKPSSGPLPVVTTDDPSSVKYCTAGPYGTDLVAKRRSIYPNRGSVNPASAKGVIPFNSTNKYHVNITNMTPVGSSEPSRYCVWMKGAPDRVLGRCDRMVKDGKTVDLSESDRKDIDNRLDRLMRKGRRVLAFAKYDMTPEETPAFPKDRSQEADKDGVPPHPFDGSAMNFPMGEDKDTDVHRAIEARLSEGDDPEVLADFRKHAHKKLVFVGMVALIDPPRPAVPDAVLSCQRAGIRVVMVTGDHPTTASAIARMVNIFTTDRPKTLGWRMVKGKPALRPDGGDFIVDPDPARYDLKAWFDEGKKVDLVEENAIVVPGWCIPAASTEELRPFWSFIFNHTQIVFARTSPSQKLQIVKAFQELEKEVVAVTGDGVNDAPALKKADIGVAMGIAGTDVTKGAADMILLDDNFASIFRGVEEGRLIFDNLKKSIAYTLSSNIPEIAPFLCFITIQTPLPLSTVLILFIDLGTDMVPAISMAWEAKEADIMRRPPRDSLVDRLVTKKLVSFAYLQIGVIQAAAGFFTWIVVMNDYGFAPHTLPGLGANDNFAKQVMYCKLNGGVWRNLDGVAYSASTDAQDAINAGFLFWDPSIHGSIEQCDFPSRNFVGELTAPTNTFDVENPASYVDYTGRLPVNTRESILALKDAGFVEYTPWRSRTSPFWRDAWLAWDYKEDGVPGAGPSVTDLVFFTIQQPGTWVIDPTSQTGDAAVGSNLADNLVRQAIGSDKTFSRATFVPPPVSETLDPVSLARQTADGSYIVNVASRMIQREALQHAQCAYFVSIVVVQWADLLICKTRWLSIYHQRMRNPAMNFGLVLETLLAAFLCYTPGLEVIFVRPLRFTHWLPAAPFSVVIFLYDEIRKSIMRSTSVARRQGQQVIMEYGWLARNTYY